MKDNINIELLFDKYKKKFFLISIYNKYMFKQYIIGDDLLYTFFLVVNFLYKYGIFRLY